MEPASRDANMMVCVDASKQGAWESPSSEGPAVRNRGGPRRTPSATWRLDCLAQRERHVPGSVVHVANACDAIGEEQRGSASPGQQPT
jgi:hypothetical protein